MADPTHIRHLAGLARLSLSEDEARALAVEADRILALFDALPSAAPTASESGFEDAGRPDEARASDPRTVEAILSQVARKDDRVILVPRGGEG